VCPIELVRSGQGFDQRKASSTGARGAAHVSGDDHRCGVRVLLGRVAVAEIVVGRVVETGAYAVYDERLAAADAPRQQTRVLWHHTQGLRDVGMQVPGCVWDNRVLVNAVTEEVAATLRLRATGCRGLNAIRECDRLRREDALRHARLG